MDYLPWVDDGNDDGLACITDEAEAINENDFKQKISMHGGQMR